ncbi:MAG: hypothetical protein ACOCQR_00800 [bacterium]
MSREIEAKVLITLKVDFDDEANMDTVRYCLEQDLEGKADSGWEVNGIHFKEFHMIEK